MYVCMSVCVYCMYVCMSVCVCNVSLYVCVYVCMCAYCMYVCVYVCFVCSGCLSVCMSVSMCVMSVCMCVMSVCMCVVSDVMSWRGPVNVKRTWYHFPCGASGGYGVGPGVARKRHSSEGSSGPGGGASAPIALFN